MYNKYRYYNATTYYIGITFIVIRTRTYNRGIITQGTFDSTLGILQLTSKQIATNWLKHGNGIAKSFIIYEFKSIQF